MPASVYWWRYVFQLNKLKVTGIIFTLPLTDVKKKVSLKILYGRASTVIMFFTKGSSCAFHHTLSVLTWPAAGRFYTASVCVCLLGWGEGVVRPARSCPDSQNKHTHRLWDGGMVRLWRGRVLKLLTLIDESKQAAEAAASHLPGSPNSSLSSSSGETSSPSSASRIRLGLLVAPFIIVCMLGKSTCCCRSGRLCSSHGNALFTC